MKTNKIENFSSSIPSYPCGGWVRTLYDIAGAPIRKNPLFYLALVSLFGISVVFIEIGKSSRLQSLFEMFGDVYLLSALMLVFPERARKYVKATVFFLLYIVGIADMMCYVTIGTALCPNIIQTWMQTNPAEASEVLGLHLNASILLSPVSLLVLVPFVFYAIRSLFYINHVSTSPIFTWIERVLLFLTFASLVFGIKNKIYLCNLLTRSSEEDAEYLFEEQTMTRDYLPAYRLMTSLSEIGRFSHMREHLLLTLQNTTIDGCTHLSPTIVLIVGESYNRHHASLYGYGKQTTPRQDILFNEGRLYRFDDVISSYNLTYKSFQNMFTFYNYDSKGMWYDYPNIFQMFRAAGYEVDFFSNQNTLRKASAFTDYCEDVFMNDYQLSGYMFSNRNAETHKFDMELLDDYRKILKGKEQNDNRLIVFHLIGMHAAYSQRFPTEERQFSEKDYKRTDLTSEQKKNLADYDNAILYNDKVIAAIIKQFNEDNAIIIHVPDHGELVYDNSTELGRKLRLDKLHIKPQFDIPFWIYCTEKYKETHQQTMSQIEASLVRPFMTDDLPHLLSGLAGIRCKEYQPQRDLISPLFNKDRARKICGEIVYR